MTPRTSRTLPLDPAAWLRLLFGLALLTLLAIPARAASGEAAMAVVKDSVEGLRTALKAEVDVAAVDEVLVSRLIEQHVVSKVDVPLSGQLILGRHWRSADETQRAAFIDAYRRLLLRTYSIHAHDYMDAKVDYLSVAPLGNNDLRYTVRTRVERLGKRPASVDYRMGEHDGQWKVFDAVVNGVSLVSTLRTAVDAEVGRIGLPALIAQLNAGKVATTTVSLQ